MQNILGIAQMLLGFSFIIFIHELGHFLLAKWNGVRVQVFSVGMGPYLFTFSRGGTLYAISALPIGGYVKMLGQEDLDANPAATADPGDYRSKRPGQRAAILAAGAIFNIIFALAAFTTCYYVGLTTRTTQIGSIPPDRPLYSATLEADGQPANLKPGDRIVSINGIVPKTFMEVLLFSSGLSPNEDVRLVVETNPHHKGDVMRVLVKPEHDKRMGASAIGIEPYNYYYHVPLSFATGDTLIASMDPSADKDFRELPAAKAGIQSKDELLAITDPGPNGTPRTIELGFTALSGVDPVTTFMHTIRGSAGRELTFKIRRNGAIQELKVKPEQDPASGLFRIGLPVGLKREVTTIDEQSAAYKAGLRTGHFVAAFLPESPNDARWKRGTLYWSESFDDVLTKTPLELKKAVLDVPEDSVNMFKVLRPAVTVYRDPELTRALATAWDDLFRYSSTALTTVKGLFSGAVSPKALSGAIGIGNVLFHVGVREDFINFLWLLGFVSLNVGILQFLPIPILDGFHLILVFIEKLKGSPVSARVQTVCFYIGAAIVGSLLVFTFFNDIVRLLKP